MILNAVTVCTEPGAGLLSALAQEENDHAGLLAALSTEELAVGVAQALSALSFVSEDLDLPLEFLLEECPCTSFGPDAGAWPAAWLV
ncbi:hypothetical protein [Kutzneria buriramensis]|uniref:hypothetical protein n=1 Tax=Kutzneria buriramensis TaxID=1045776 RepID=UPI000E22966B|nr:hypothetical protein [Kutzneria buriramensis]